MPRLPRLDTPGALHHIMIRGINRTKLFLDDEDRKAFLARLGMEVIKAESTIYAWSLMDNHVHLLFKSGRGGLTSVMRKLLTWYAQYFNRRHKRSGHLFENRYKSILCQEDSYLLPLARYIHLNPERVGKARTIEELRIYPWCGHGAIMGDKSYEWMNTKDVLLMFGRKIGQARAAYEKYVADGIGSGRNPELTGGGLVRSMGGWSNVKTARSMEEDLMHDERILGDSAFLQAIIKEADQRQKRQLRIRLKGRTTSDIVKDECKKSGISVKELQSGSRRRVVSMLRKKISLRCVKELGATQAEIARHIGVCTSNISHLMANKKAR